MSNELGWSLTELTGAITAQSLAGMFLSPLVGPLLDKFGARPVMAFGALSENERADSMVAQIAQGVAAHAVANWRRERDELSADTPIRAEIICRQHTLQSIDNVRSGTPRQRNPHDPAFFRNIYEADILVDTRTGSVELNRRRQAGQVAPIEIDNNPPAGGTQNTTSGIDVGVGKGLTTTNGLPSRGNQATMSRN